MYKTEIELFSQYEALKRTYRYLMENEGRIREFFSHKVCKSLIFTGCGSSYSLCKSAAISCRMRMVKPSYSIAAGDLMINYTHYDNILKDSIVVAPSRSGSTSEVIKAVQAARDIVAGTVAISAKSASGLADICDLSLEIPWAFDESVCQTRTVTNLYIANLMLLAIVMNDSRLLDEINSAVENESFIHKNSETLKSVAKKDWDKIIILADSELEGIAEEAALAFKEISRLQSAYYHFLDLRHGPMVLVDNKTLVIAVTSPLDDLHQKNLIKDLKSKGAFVLTASSKNKWDSDVNIEVPEYENFCVTGIPFIFIPQALSYFKALERGINPDAPEGLEPWIKL